MRFLAKRLQARLLAWTAFILVICVAVTFEIRTRLNLTLLQDDLQDRAETLVIAVGRAIDLSSMPVDPVAVSRRLSEFVEADRSLDRLDIIQERGNTVRVLASSDITPDPLIHSIPPVLTTTTRDDDMITVMPIEGTAYAILASSSLENLERYETLNHARDPMFEAVLILTVIVLMNVMYRRIVSKRVDELLAAIHRSQKGNFVAIPETREDEIGVIAGTLNGLLTQVRSFNEKLQREVSSATENLNKRNIELEEITRQVVAMQRQLLQAERLATVGQMAATFAHEIGSPMSSLSVHVQLLLEDPQLTFEQRETLGIVREQIQSMIQIVNDLLRSARRGPADFVPTDVNDTLQAVIRLVQPKFKSQHIAVETHYEPVPKVRAYPLYLQEAFLNLINNASDAMLAGGVLHVRTFFDLAADRVNIHIEDTGSGIDPSVVEHVFDHFVTTKAMGDGTGLGLGIVKEIVTSHSGTLQIAAAPGGGTSAHITLPAGSHPERWAEPQAFSEVERGS
jgi:signal transduction histidine kinase